MNSEPACWWAAKLDRCAEAGWPRCRQSWQGSWRRWGGCATCEPGGLAAAVRGLDPAKLVPYCRGGPAGVAAAIDRVMGFDD